MSYYIKRITVAVIMASGMNAWADQPIFSVTPRVNAPAQIIRGEETSAVYQVTNNSSYNLTGLGAVRLPEGVSIIPSAGIDYCSSPFNLAAHGSCLLKLKIDSTATSSSTVSGGPIVCYSAAQPFYCNQPYQQEQLNVQILPSTTQTCNQKASNFNYQLMQNFNDTSAPPVGYWGAIPTAFTLNPDVSSCRSTSWDQQRVVAAADFWIRQKLNYCHHYMPDWMTPVGAGRQTTDNDAAGYCSPATDLAPNSTYYGQVARWNYSGTASQTLDNWQNNNYMWYGVDCSNYTRLIYNFGLGVEITGDVQWQAGQKGMSDSTAEHVSPNEGGLTTASTEDAPGALLCTDGSLASGGSCGAGTDKFFSIINHSGVRTSSLVTDAMLDDLHPGDLLYIAGDGINSKVTHVVMWTGKTVGNGTNQIPASQIAPDSICPDDWQPTDGQWVITDSHYQGADYRAFTNCFYRNNLWGVRRIIT